VNLSTIQRLVLAAVTTIAGGSLALSLIFVLDDAADDREVQSTVDEIIAARTEARAVTCEKDRKFAEAHNALVARDNEFLIVLATGAGEREIRPEDQPIVDEQIAANNRNLVTVPDCSPEGIKAFYEGR
jgi:hypothetical protein